MTATTTAPRGSCPRLIREGRYSRTFCDRRAGDDGVCRRHRYVERLARAALARRHAEMRARLKEAS